MTVTLFITLLTAFSAVNTLIVEAIKKIIQTKTDHYSSNLIAVICALVVGSGGTAAYYTLFTIPFTSGNIVCMCLMGLAVAVSSMVGYDKIVQLIEQLKK